MKNWILTVKYYLNKFIELGVLLLAVSVLAEILFGPDVAFFGSQVTKNLINLLISKGADVNFINEDGETPLDRLSSEELEGVTAEIAVLLRKHGAKTGEELKAEGK